MVPNSSVIEQVKKKHNCDSRINNLPDELLGQILSLLPTKDAVATSVLSKRWKSMYTLITQLDFDDSPISFCQNHPHLIEHWPSFRKFVDHVLSKFQSGNIITRFRLKFGKPAESNHHPPFDGDYCPEMCYPVLHPTPLGKWMCFPLTRGVRELDLCTRSRKPGYLPFALFRCQTLEVLKLQVNHHLRLPKSFHLPNLRVFHLTIDRILFGNFIARLLSKCPLLEDLAVVGDWGNDNHPIEIVSAPSLRRLVITNRGDEDTQRSTFVVDAPFLEYLRYSDFLAFQYSVGTLNALVEAQIYILCCLQTEESTYEVILDLIRPLSNVRHLTLCEDTVEGLEGSRLEGNNNNNKLPIFHNLKHLKLGFGYSQGHKVMLELLRVAPFLETLEFWSLKMYGHYGSENSEGLMREIAVEIENWSTCETITIPSCLEFHLKKIVVLDVFTGTELEVAVIQYFLRNGLVLEEVDIRCAECSVPIADWILLDRKIQNLPRRSTACSIKLRR